METPEQRDRRHAQMAAIQAERKHARKTFLRRSRLDPYRAEIQDFAQQGVGATDIAHWLARHRRVRVDPTTIKRRLKAWTDHA